MDHSGRDEDGINIPVLDQAVSRIGFGCEALGGFNWGDVDPEGIQDAVRAAMSGLGPNQSILFDTSDTYGPHLSEERLGEALENQWNNAVVATKFGVRLKDGGAWYDNSASYADFALDSSLSRLRRDSIDLYQLHWPDKVTPIATTLTTLERFREEGRIKAYGICNVPLAELLDLVGDFPGLASFSLPYSLIDRADRKDIQALCDTGLVFLAYGCLAQGLLSGKYSSSKQFGANDRRATSKYIEFHGERLERNLVIVDALREGAERSGFPVPTLALRFVLEDLPGAIALAGIKSVDQWTQNVRAEQLALPPEIYVKLREVSDETLS